MPSKKGKNSRPDLKLHGTDNHGTDNLYVVSNAVLPSMPPAHPTLTLVALIFKCFGDKFK
jgi:hypothetical protein